ncbi:hypothetical protein WN51_05845 [Melipona quadrifasciata]|uniref:Uncharacterized protein n=1 Tax=Melipona quadrifasciata TaxID=166423 RepID=A0A0M9A614_9HYME|nr:hypothetical protein WN51_05845 [Melipona quadrifasciata]
MATSKAAIRVRDVDIELIKAALNFLKNVTWWIVMQTSMSPTFEIISKRQIIIRAILRLSNKVARNCDVRFFWLEAGQGNIFYELEEHGIRSEYQNGRCVFESSYEEQKWLKRANSLRATICCCAYPSADERTIPPGDAVKLIAADPCPRGLLVAFRIVEKVDEVSMTRCRKLHSIYQKNSNNNDTRNSFILCVKFLFSSLRDFPSTVFFGKGFGIHLEKKASSDTPLKIRRGCCCLYRSGLTSSGLEIEKRECLDVEQTVVSLHYFWIKVKRKATNILSSIAQCGKEEPFDIAEQKQPVEHNLITFRGSEYEVETVFRSTRAAVLTTARSSEDQDHHGASLTVPRGFRMPRPSKDNTESKRKDIYSTGLDTMAETRVLDFYYRFIQLEPDTIALEPGNTTRLYYKVLDKLIFITIFQQASSNIYDQYMQKKRANCGKNKLEAINILEPEVLIEERGTDRLGVGEFLWEMGRRSSRIKKPVCLSIDGKIVEALAQE